MKILIKYKPILFVIIFSLILIVGYLFLQSPKSNQNEIANVSSGEVFGWKYPVAKFPSVGSGIQVAYSGIRSPGGVPEGLPVRLKIPIINVDSIIEDALITPDGRMDVPAGSVNVAWFALGPHPGQIGSAVIGGHFGIRDGVKFVFYDLDKVKIGDNVYILNDKGEKLAFVVRKIKLFDRNADATTVFTSDDGIAHLNIITCEGIWNVTNGNYPQRRVVFTDFISAGGEIITPSVFSQSLSVGVHGRDVEELQIILIQKGFLTIPLGISSGYFGNLTKSALAKYQTSVGLPAVGIFGPLTRAMFNFELKNKPILPDTGVEESTILNNIKGLFSTLIDGLVSSFLLFFIFFFLYKITEKKRL